MVYMHCPIFEVLLKIHSIFFILCETFCIQIICRVGSLTDMRRASLVLGVWRGRKMKRVLSSGFEWWLRSKMIVRPGYTASSHHSLSCIQHPKARFSLFQKRNHLLGETLEEQNWISVSHLSNNNIPILMLLNIHEYWRILELSISMLQKAKD